ncbi:MAG: ABC transporter ATP-binding protein [Victivallales bacterium]|nr:ABC transporter ATP-binding protein [Victivallales bacterium]
MKITIEKLCKKFGDVSALSDVDLQIADGELVVLLGPSGCGKTTLLRCIGGFEMPTSGKILLDSEDVAQLPPNKRNTAMVFQGYALWPHMTVYENIAFGLEMKGLSAQEISKQVNAAMESVQIAQLASRRPNELSGGQQQRVALARTLVVHPGCLLLDEPLANLDAKLRRDMRLEIRRLCKDNGLTGIYVTHDRQEALSMADSVAVLKDGRIVQTGSPDEIYRKPVNAFVASFIGETNFIQGVLVSMDGDGAEVETAAGVLHAENHLEGARVGEKVTLSIRPEAITLNSAVAGEGANEIAATLETSAYLGEVANHTARTGQGGILLSFLELNPRAASQAGSKCTVYIPRSDIRVLPFAENPT